jgi:hypothetical protein
MLGPARYRADSRSIGTAISHRRKPHLVRNTFDSCRPQAIILISLCSLFLSALSS